MAKKKATKSFDLKTAIRSKKEDLYDSLLDESVNGKGIAKLKAIELLAKFGEFESEGSADAADVSVIWLEVKREPSGDIVPAKPATPSEPTPDKGGA